ncbi:hypothetical protein NDU88_005330 [Pleurodeles waltl]|uniref:Uncharacterized protein n=1 Tax=Pleurodeles waltl TaxID=8319 RepID=A0AAV7MZV1_PLEWA|nr:hypothetical protein NDU88_005330 [Pleurodeles waltl]
MVDPNAESEEDPGAKGFVKMIVDLGCPRVLLLEEMVEETKKDGSLWKVKEALQRDHWQNFLEIMQGLADEEREAR